MLSGHASERLLWRQMEDAVGEAKLGNGKVREAMEGRELVRKKTVGINMFGWCMTRVVKAATESTMHASRSSTRDLRAVANAKLRP